MKPATFVRLLLATVLLISACASEKTPPEAGDPAGGRGPDTATNPKAGGSDPEPPIEKDPVTALTQLGAQFTRYEDGAAKTITLARTKARDAELAYLSEMTTLEGLNLYATEVTDAGLAHLAGLTNLRWLNLTDTSITDVGLAHLKGLTALESLDLEGTAVTDPGLRHLSGLTNLRRVNLEATRVSEMGVEELRRALPNLTASR